MDVSRSASYCHEDDWLFSSTTKYDALHMFELLHPVRAMDWVDSAYIALGTGEFFGDNEIQLLSIPERLLMNDAEKEGITEERDFHLCGGALHEKPLIDAHHVTGTRLLLTSESGSSGILSWQLPEVHEMHETDMIQKGKTFSGFYPSSKTATFCVNLHKKLFQGSSVKQVSVQDLEADCAAPLMTGDQLGGSGIADEPLSRMLSIGADTVLLCFKHSAGAVLVDTRSREIVMQLKDDAAESASRTQTWTACANEVHCMCTSAAGRLLAFDIRGAARVGPQPESTTTTSVPPLFRCYTSKSWPGRPRQCVDLCIQISPHDGDTISISGLDSLVRLYSLNAVAACGNDGTGSGQASKTLFEHDGHGASATPAQTVLSHMWHPSIANMVISSDSDGGLQCWKYKISTAANE